MALEAATNIPTLVATNPVHTDQISQADSHIRLIKAVLLSTFPTISGPVTITLAELNALTGVTARVTAMEANRLRKDIDQTLTGSLTTTVDVLATRDVIAGRDIGATRNIAASGAIAAVGNVTGAQVNSVSSMNAGTDVNALAGAVYTKDVSATAAGTTQRTVRLVQQGAATDQKIWETVAEATTGDLSIRALNDALSTSSPVLQARRGALQVVSSVGLFTSGTERIRVISDGKVGFGITVPTEVVHVVGNIKATGQFIGATSALTGASTAASFAATGAVTGASSNVTGTATSAAVATGTVNATGLATVVGLTSSADIAATGTAKFLPTASGIQFSNGSTQTVAASAYAPTATLAAALAASLPIPSTGTLQIKAGSGTTNISGLLTVSFATAFPTAIVALIPTITDDTVGNNVLVFGNSPAVGGGTIKTRTNGGGVVASVPVSWIAIGY